jgi:hypothetical protein
MNVAADVLTKVVADLYQQPLRNFTKARDAAAKACSEPAIAQQIKKLRKPTVAAWAINLLVRRESERVNDAIEVGEALRAAARELDAVQLRGLTKQRRRLTEVLAQEAVNIAHLEGQSLTNTVLEQIQETLTASMIDELAAQAVRSGALVSALQATGVEPAGAAEAVAVPEAIGMVAPATGRPRAQLRLVPGLDSADVKQLERAQATFERAKAALLGAQRAQELAQAEVAQAQAAVLQVQAEIAELQHQLAERETYADELDAVLELAQATEHEADLATTTAASELAAASLVWQRLTQS